MTVKKIRNITELKMFTSKLKALQRTISIIQLKALEKAADEAILSDIHRDMETSNVSKKIIEKTYVGPIEIIPGQVATIHFISDYMPDNGFDVGLAREEGTKDHMIKPVTKKALSWIDPRSGKRRFDSVGHMVTGLPRLLTVERVIHRNKQKAQNAYEKNIISAYKQALSV